MHIKCSCPEMYYCPFFLDSDSEVEVIEVTSSSEETDEGINYNLPFKLSIVQPFKRY